MPETRTFAFRLHGHAYHLVLDDPSDLRWAVELDAALWVANSASIETINADAFPRHSEGITATPRPTANDQEPAA